MISKLLASRGGRGIVLTLTVALSFLLSALILRHGIKSWPDSWYYWEGSVNLMEHGTFTTMLGVPIQDWLPLYSVYLIPFEQLFGQTGWALILSMCVLVALNVAVWGAYVFKVFPTDEKSSVVGIFGSLIFLAFFLPISCNSILANALLLLFVGLMLHLLAAISEDTTPWGGIVKSGLVGILLGAGIFTHNSSIIYVVASIIIVLLSMPTPILRRAIAVSLIILLSGIAWMNVPSHGIRLSADGSVSGANADSALASSAGMAPLEGSHILFAPYYSFQEYLVQAPSGIGTFFISASSIPIQLAVGVIILILAIVLLLQRPATKLESRHRIFLGFGLLVFLGHFAIFNLVWLCCTLSDRFSWYFALVMVPIFFCRFRQHKWIMVILLLATVGVSGWRLSKVVRSGVVSPLVATSSEVTEFAIHQQYYLTSKANPVVPAGAIQIDPPLYIWQKTLSGTPPANPHASVRLVRSEINRP